MEFCPKCLGFRYGRDGACMLEWDEWILNNEKCCEGYGREKKLQNTLFRPPEAFLQPPSQVYDSCHNDRPAWLPATPYHAVRKSPAKTVISSTPGSNLLVHPSSAPKSTAGDAKKT